MARSTWERNGNVRHLRRIAWIAISELHLLRKVIHFFSIILFLFFLSLSLSLSLTYSSLSCHIGWNNYLRCLFAFLARHFLHAYKPSRAENRVQNWKHIVAVIAWRNVTNAFTICRQITGRELKLDEIFSIAIKRDTKEMRREEFFLFLPSIHKRALYIKS